MKRSQSRRSLLAILIFCAAGIQPATKVAAQSGSPPQEPPPQEPPPETRSPAPLPVPDLEELEDDRLTFSYPVPAERGGGTVSGRAGSLEQTAPQQAVLSDQVELHYKDLTVQADRVELDLEVNQVRASGHIVLDQGPRRVTAETLEFDLDSETGTFYDATAYLDPDFYFRGRTVEKVGEDAYVVRNGVFTSCSAEVPQWSFRVARARVKVNGYARATHTAMRIKKMPILYFPYILWPVKEERTSGLLIPDIGYSDHRGSELGLAYFQTFGDSFDATLHVDLYERNFRGYGTDIRYRPTEGTSGSLRGYRVEKRDEAGEGSESRLDYVHDSQDLPGGLRGVLRITDYSDFDFFAQQFERQINNLTRRSIYSSGFLSGSWSAHSLNLLVDQRETFSTVGGETVTTTQRQLPELEYGLRTRQIGRTPLYFSLRSSQHVIEIEPRDTAAETIQYERSHWVPELSLPFSRLPWLSMTASVQERFTWYSDSVDPVTRTFPEEAESLSRAIPNAALEIVGPSFSRIYDREAGSFARFKHVVEPRITYTYAAEYEEQDQVPFFDEIDQLGARNVVVVGVVNRLLAKPKPPRDLREALAAAEARAAGGGGTETDEAAPGEEAAAEDEGDDEDGGATQEPAGDEMLPSVTEQLDREEDLATGVTGATGAFDTLSEQAALMAATSPREIMSFQVAQARTFEEECPLERAGSVSCPLLPVEESEVVQPGVNLWGPVVASLRFNPSSRISLDSQVNYSPLFSEVTSASLSTGLSFGRYAQHNIGASWYTQYNQREVTDNVFALEEGSNQLRLHAGIEVWPGRLKLGTQLNYNIHGYQIPGEDTLRHIQSQGYSLTYTSQCYAFDLNYYERHFSGDLISEIRFAVSLKNVGTLLDLKSGLSSSY